MTSDSREKILVLDPSSQRMSLVHKSASESSKEAQRVPCPQAAG